MADLLILAHGGMWDMRFQTSSLAASVAAGGSEATAEGQWSQGVACSPGQRISFKVRDRDGRGLWSEVDEIGCGVTE